MPARILARDQQRQLERLREAEPADLLRRRLGDEQVAALERSAEDGAGMPLRGRRSSSPGPRRLPESRARGELGKVAKLIGPVSRLLQNCYGRVI